MQTTNRLLFVFTAAALSACATTRMDAQWTNPEYQGRNVRGASVLVACEAPDLTVQRICEDQLAAAVSARGCKGHFEFAAISGGPPRPLEMIRISPLRSALVRVRSFE